LTTGPVTSRLGFGIWLRPYDDPVLHDFSLRPLLAADSALLATATLGNLNWGEERFTATDLSTRPDFSHYTVVDHQRGDFGWVAEAGKDAIGVVWAQYLPPDDPGYGFLAEDTPEVSLWVRGDWRGQGVGRALLRQVQDDARARGVPRLSLSVEADKDAKKLYTAEGFVDVPGRAADGVLAWNP
jgi:GNAT superfamily N-acetyltransferase